MVHKSCCAIRVSKHIETSCGWRQKSHTQRTQQWRANVREGCEFRHVQEHHELDIQRFVHHKLCRAVDSPDERKVRGEQLPVDHDARRDQQPESARRTEIRKRVGY